ncbi:hypothetical protein CC85DRAFT_253687 [Cutaneotrichosporon oleaginosum]|uniref:Restriction endonuclease type IV Mrr domain-containing protein n=1 Tax=Cutaneotrichosporon oleaginosum TaxID=879819 RepID=A0A0J0XZV1_9TREE|nr:uncharacterized protein CC85DRAFT_253687 [Cutaneotrichosporon oleaginosum]KLT46551.1 hypothetical protein CC85DRAFT_253687 [Cutaneotrichosporon oleaginosum]TXT15082.1 hypothetical protein COLE_01275 [Cutaneotrichosporon oleaginosum]
MAGPSTRAIGLAFENHTQRFLNGDLRMALSHVGGRGDGGVDLRGFWWVPRRPRRRTAKATPSPLEAEGSGTGSENGAWKPPTPPGLKRDGTPGARIRPLRVVAQCKAERRVVGPRIVREFEGTLAHLAAQDARVPLLGVLASQSGFSLASMEHAVRARVPLLLLHLEGGRPEEEGESDDAPPEKDVVEGAPAISVTGAWWNAPLGALLTETGVELRREIMDGNTRVGLWTAGSRMGRYGPAG